MKKLLAILALGLRAPGPRAARRCAQDAAAAAAAAGRRGRSAAAAAAAAGGRRRGAPAAAAAAAAPTPNKGDVALDADVHAARHHDDHARPGAVLRRPGAQQEHAVGADAGVRRSSR
ncbi:MAG: hypothetical protein MZW92_68930 [Comamonadaceae bacterium]|nr:hypothetical protein [Comamonadaceae bacterium]